MPATEFEIIERYFRQAAKQSKSVVCGIGDDAAVVELPPGQQLVVSTDTLVSGVHFFQDADPSDVGYKSLAVNMSDMAAMGADPLWVTMCLTLPDNNIDWIRKFADGFFTLADRYSVSLVGGDLTHGPLSISIQIMGAVPAGKALKRSGAKPGDLVYVTGRLGLAALAVAVLKGETTIYQQPPSICLDKLNRPVPRLEIGSRLRGIAGAVIDISDGLAGDLGHILDASSAGAEIELNKVPVAAELRKLDAAAMWQYALNGGDDYELCFTLPVTQQEKLEQAILKLDFPVTCIGRIIKSNGITWLQGGKPYKEIVSGGYRHF
jgi:thiamine-monophosphate kinase